MWYGSTMQFNPDHYRRIRVPIHWAGSVKDSREGPAWSCGACSDPDACIDNDRTCLRARPEHFTQAGVLTGDA